MSTNDEIFPKDWIWGVQTFIGGKDLIKYIMGLGQGSRAAPPSWIQLSLILINVYKQLGLGSYMTDPISLEEIHSAGALFIDNADLYTGDDRQPDTEEQGANQSCRTMPTNSKKSGPME